MSPNATVGGRPDFSMAYAHLWPGGVVALRHPSSRPEGRIGAAGSPWPPTSHEAGPDREPCPCSASATRAPPLAPRRGCRQPALEQSVARGLDGPNQIKGQRLNLSRS